jgi:hypothetical protein
MMLHGAGLIFGPVSTGTATSLKSMPTSALFIYNLRVQSLVLPRPLVGPCLSEAQVLQVGKGVEIPGHLFQPWWSPSTLCWGHTAQQVASEALCLRGMRRGGSETLGLGTFTLATVISDLNSPESYCLKTAVFSLILLLSSMF